MRFEVTREARERYKEQVDTVKEQLNQRVQANKNTSVTYCQRIKNLESIVEGKDLELGELSQMAEELRQSIQNKKQDQMMLSSELEKSRNDMLT